MCWHSLKVYTRNESENQIGENFGLTLSLLLWLRERLLDVLVLGGDSAKMVSRNHRQFCSNKSLTDLEQVAYDPKDGDLWLGRAKPYESVVEARSDSDVQIDRQTRV